MAQVIKLAVLGAALVAMPQAALAQSKDKAKDAGPQLVTCEKSLGVVALVDGDQAGGAKWGLGAPRADPCADQGTGLLHVRLPQ